MTGGRRCRCGAGGCGSDGPDSYTTPAPAATETDPPLRADATSIGCAHRPADRRGQGARQHVHRGRRSRSPPAPRSSGRTAAATITTSCRSTRASRGASRSRRSIRVTSYSHVFTEPGDVRVLLHDPRHDGRRHDRHDHRQLTAPVTLSTTGGLEHEGITSGTVGIRPCSPWSLVVAACGGSDGDSAADTTGVGSGSVTTERRHDRTESTEPGSTDAPTTDAPDDTSAPASEPGPLACSRAGRLRHDHRGRRRRRRRATSCSISPGVYHEAVNVVDRRDHDPGARSQRGDPRRRVRTRQRHPVLGATRRGRREPDRAELHQQRRVRPGRGRRLPGVVPHRLPQRRLRHLRLRLDQRHCSSTPTPRAAPTPASTSASASSATR